MSKSVTLNNSLTISHTPPKSVVLDKAASTVTVITNAETITVSNNGIINISYTIT